MFETEFSTLAERFRRALQCSADVAPKHLDDTSVAAAKLMRRAMADGLIDLPVYDPLDTDKRVAFPWPQVPDDLPPWDREALEECGYSVLWPMLAGMICALDDSLPRDPTAARLQAKSDEGAVLITVADDTVLRAEHYAAICDWLAAYRRPAEVRLQNDDRDQWIYNQCIEGVEYMTIRSRLRKHKKWVSISTISGIKLAAQRYAARHDKPEPPARKHGRKSAKKRGRKPAR